VSEISATREDQRDVRPQGGEADVSLPFTPESKSPGDRAVAHLQQHATASLLQLIFECRSRQLSGELSATNAAAYLSGLLIGEDVFGALRLYATPTAPIAIIGTPQLTQLYATACATCGIQAQQIDGAQASLAGLTVFYLQRNG